MGDSTHLLRASVWQLWPNSTIKKAKSRPGTIEQTFTPALGDRQAGTSDFEARPRRNDLHSPQTLVEDESYHHAIQIHLQSKWIHQVRKGGHSQEGQGDLRLGAHGGKHQVHSQEAKPVLIVPGVQQVRAHRIAPCSLPQATSIEPSNRHLSQPTTLTRVLRDSSCVYSVSLPSTSQQNK